jgi:hypothetical protein
VVIGRQGKRGSGIIVGIFLGQIRQRLRIARLNEHGIRNIIYPFCGQMKTLLVARAQPEVSL